MARKNIRFILYISNNYKDANLQNILSFIITNERSESLAEARLAGARLAGARLARSQVGREPASSLSRCQELG